ALERLPYARVVAERGERSNQRRPYELRRLLLERGDELGHQRFVGIVLEEAVSDDAKAIVRAGERLAHRVDRARVVEAGQQHERSIANVAVRLFCDRLHQRRYCLRARRSPYRTRRRRARFVVEVPELGDRGLQLRSRYRLWRARFLGARGSHGDEDTEERTKDTEENSVAASRHGSYPATVSVFSLLSSFNAS